MPTVSAGSGDSLTEIYYEVRGDTASSSFGATLDCWEPQLDGLLNHQASPGGVSVSACLLDNRGVGRSGSPKARQAYTTTIMAEDCIAVLNALKWDQVHVIGHSMGAMVATQLASMHPDRLLSLTLISTFWASTIEDRAKVDLKFHFMKKTLNEV
ncbi:MAG: hypothetical protein FRX49_05330, partial [Trebouxia sp. A1-2]